MLPITAKVSNNLRQGIEKIAGLHALAAEPGVAPWSSAGVGDPSLARDDDLRTGWRCTPGEPPCAIGIASAESMSVKVLRLYTAHGPDWRDYTGGAKIEQIRVHTDAGYIDASLGADPQHQYVVLSEPVSTRTIAIEVLQSKPGRRGADVIVAEIEVFGETGPKRAPLDLDPERSFVTYETQPWKVRGEQEHIARIVFVEVLSPEAQPIRIARGSALLGRKGDRFLLLEKLSTASCDATGGSWTLIDQHTRMHLPLGTMGGIPAEVRVHPGGLGFAFVQPGAMPQAVVLEDDAPEIKRPKKKDTDPVAALASWGFAEAVPLRRGGHRMPEVPSTCSPMTASAEVLAAALGREASPSGFVACKLGEDATAIVGARGLCGNDWSLVLADADLKSTKKNRRHARDVEGARGIRMTALADGLLVEVSKEAGASANLYFLGASLIEVAKGAGLAVHAPAICDPCDDRFDRTAPLAVGEEVPAVPVVPTELVEPEPEPEPEPEEEEHIAPEEPDPDAASPVDAPEDPAPLPEDPAPEPPADTGEPAQTEG